eukprot:403336231
MKGKGQINSDFIFVFSEVQMTRIIIFGCFWEIQNGSCILPGKSSARDKFLKTQKWTK